MKIKKIISAMALSLCLFGLTGCEFFYSRITSEDSDGKYVVNGKYAVIFDTDGGSSIATQTVDSGERAIKPTNPSKEGYTFGGWYKNASLTDSFDFETNITSNITVYAKWIKNEVTQYTVTFNTEGGSSISSQKVNSGSTVILSSNPTRSGCIFDGWYTSYTYTTKFSTSTKITSNTTLYAKWILGSSYSLDMSCSSKTWDNGVSLYTIISNRTGFDIYYLEEVNINIYDKSNNYVCADGHFGSVKPSGYIKNGSTINNWEFFFKSDYCDLSYWKNKSFTFKYSIKYNAILLPNELK